MNSQATRRALLRTSAGLAALLALAACGQATTGATTSDVTGTAASPSAPATTTAVSEASASPTTSTAVTSSTAVASTSATTRASITSTGGTPSAASNTTVASTSAPATNTASAGTASARAVKLTLDGSGTQANYRVQEQLAGHNFPSEAIGKTSAVNGAIVLDGQGAIVPSQSKFEIDMRTLTSDQTVRDNYIQHNPLQTSEYPMATFVPTKAAGVPWPLPASGAATLSLDGNMTVHGTTAPMTWAVSVTFAGDKVTGTAQAPFTFTQFGMQPPHTAIALSVENKGTLELQFSATKTTA